MVHPMELRTKVRVTYKIHEIAFGYRSACIVLKMPDIDSRRSEGGDFRRTAGRTMDRMLGSVICTSDKGGDSAMVRAGGLE